MDITVVNILALIDFFRQQRKNKQKQKNNTS